VRCTVIFLLVCGLATTLGCGNGQPIVPPGVISGNWEISLQRHAHPGSLTFSGFMLQSGSTINGSMILGGGCNGVGPLSGTLNGQNLSLTIDEFGQEISLNGTLPSGSPSSSTFISGGFSALAGGCADFASTGTWSATRVTPIAGTFHGTMTGAATTFNVSGSLTQGANTGSSTATLTGTIVATGAAHFCPYLTSATINGLISGTTVTLDLFDSTGAQITQITPASVTANGASLSCTAGSATCYSFQAISNSCTGENGAIQLTFP
jgi:hypothetical protein